MKKKNLAFFMVAIVLFTYVIQPFAVNADTTDNDISFESTADNTDSISVEDASDELSVIDNTEDNLTENENGKVIEQNQGKNTNTDEEEPSTKEQFREEEIVLANEESLIQTLNLDDEDDVTNISVNTSYTDNLTSSSDVNWYKFTITSNGYISLSFSHAYIESSYNYWRAYLYDESQTELSSYSFAGSTMEYDQGNIGVPSGTYYLKITLYSTSFYSDMDYKIKVNYSSSGVWETEFNDQYTEADAISVNTDYYGSLRNSDDADWYKFTISNNGYISLSFSHAYIESSYNYWRAYLYDESLTELASYLFAGSTMEYNQGNIGVPSGTYYLKITLYSTSFYSDMDYKIRMNYSSSSVWETELNDKNTEADAISVNTTYYGNLRNSSDVDWYTFSLSSGGMQILYFNHDYVSSGYRYWKLYIYDSTMTEISYYTFIGNTTESSEIMYLSKGTYYIKIEDYNYSDVNYNFKISPHTHSFRDVVTKATTSSNGKIVKTCSCGETNGTTIIYYPETISLSATKYTYDGKVKTPRITVRGSDGSVISSSNYSVSYSSGRKNVGRYKVQVKFTGNYTGTVSRSYVINPRGTSISKLTKKSKAFTVRWKKQTSQVSGYQIQYSTNKYFSYAATKTIGRNSTTSATYKGLQGKKKYFVRIRTYKAVSGTKYYSAWSSAKSVTTKK
jgi:hypothetical protein